MNSGPGRRRPQPRADWEQVARPPESTEASVEQAAFAVDHPPEKVPVALGSTGGCMAAALKWIRAASEPVWGQIIIAVSREPDESG